MLFRSFTAKKPGVYVLAITLKGVSAQATFAAKDLKDVNLARLARVTASGEENPGLVAKNAVDGDATTRWGSRHRDGEWIQLDFGQARKVSGLRVKWEAARAETCRVEASQDGATWKTLVDCHAVANAEADEISWPATSARYLRLTGLTRNTNYGISIFELDVR